MTYPSHVYEKSNHQVNHIKSHVFYFLKTWSAINVNLHIISAYVIILTF